MKIFYSIDEYAAQHGRSRVALGFFDGVHAGHRAVIAACREEGSGDKTVVLTFRESPAAALGLPVPPVLTNNDRKAALFASLGVDAVIFADFGDLRDLTPEEFVNGVLRDRLGAVEVCCGYNYRFGRGGAGDTAALGRLCAAAGIGVTVKEPVTVDGEAVSSTRIRELLEAGEIARANRMLGSPYAIGGAIRSGNHLGTQLGFPTVNLTIGAGQSVPRYGVYASRVTVSGAVYHGATNIGVRPTVENDGMPLCESFLIDYTGGDLYGEEALCELLDFVRAERRFGSVEELQVQVTRDIDAVRKRNTDFS